MSVDSINRRRFLGLFGAATAMPAFAIPVPPSHHAPDFSFIFLTDSHLEPELDGVHGTDLAMRKARQIPADFAIQGGDHIMDSNAVTLAKATQNFDLYEKTQQDLGLKVHHTLGNHDIFGIKPASGATSNDPLYGKKIFEARFGPTYYSFDHKGVHFIVLDSVGITPEGKYEGRIADDQLAWLTQDLAALPARMPIIVSTHIPLVTAAWNAYSVPASADSKGTYFKNGPATIKLLAGYNVLGVLQGHTHINETVFWQGIPFITSGAVCGNWWHGPHWNTPEGFTVASVKAGKLTTHYVPSGFQSVAPENG